MEAKYVFRISASRMHPADHMYPVYALQQVTPFLWTCHRIFVLPDRSFDTDTEPAMY